MSRIYFVRHGTHGLLGRALAGRMPGVDLSAAGHVQADALAKHFGASTGIGSVVSSPMERCRQTAAPIAERLGLPIESSEALDELDCGAWTGATFAALAEDPRWRAWNQDRSHAGAPGGETAEAVQVRVMALVDHHAAADRAPAVMVTHGDVIKTVVLTLLGASLDLHDRLDIDPASITTVDLWTGGGKVVRSNQILA